MTGKGLLATTAIAAMALGTGAAHAQDTAAAAATAASGGDNGEIIVTAQRRSEKLRDVPISITAISQDTLVKSGIANTIDIQRVTPAVQLPLFGGFLQPVVRGIGSQNSGLGDSSNVAVYVDGVYQPSQSGQLLDLPDIQQIEVLKGPQGTLYGQNAAGGAITLTSVRPSFTWTGRMSASYGNYDNLALRGYVSGPLAADKAALSIAAGFQDRKGFKTNVAKGERDSGLNSKTVRARLLLAPSDTFEVIVTGFYGKRSDGGIYAGQPIGPGRPTGYGLADLRTPPLTIARPSGPWEFAANEDTLTRITSYGGNVLGKLDTGIGTFSTVTAYGNVKVLDLVDADYTAANVGGLNLTVKNHNFIQEVNFASEKFGDATLSAGLFYMALKESYDPNIFALYAFAPNVPPVTTVPAVGVPLFLSQQYAYNRKRSYAGYVELAYDISDRLNLTVGGRYSHETQRTADNRTRSTGSIVPILFPDPRGTVSFNKFTPRATLRYAITPDANIYASYSKGFKSGYVNSGDPNSTPVPAPVRPEVVDAYEAGFKGRLAPGVNVNVAAFWYDYKDIQVYVYGVPVEIYLNAASGRIKGIDGDISLSLAPGLTVTAGGAYLDAKYRNFPGAIIYVPAPAGYGYATAPYDASGRQMIRSPKWSGNLAVNYEVETGAGKIGAYVAGNYNSGIKYDVAGIIRQREYALLDAELSYAPDGLNGVRLVLWGKNLTNKAYLQSVLTSQFVNGGSFADPRTYGVRAEFKF